MTDWCGAVSIAAAIGAELRRRWHLCEEELRKRPPSPSVYTWFPLPLWCFQLICRVEPCQQIWPRLVPAKS